MLWSLFILTIGIVLLIHGATRVVDGTTSLAQRLGIPPIIIAITVISFGTSAPELAVNFFAFINQQNELGVSNILGSSIANIFLILGIAALTKPLIFKKENIWREVPILFFATALLWYLTKDNLLSQTDGAILIASFSIFLAYTYSILSKQKIKKEFTEKPALTSILALSIGLVALLAGGKLAVDSASEIARILGISERVIGITIVAIGTSLPELITTVIAAKKRNVDVVLGTIIGSNIFNILWILGLSASFQPIPFMPQNLIDVLIALSAIALLFLAVFVGEKYTLKRWEGGLFVAIYVSYLLFFVLPS